MFLNHMMFYTFVVKGYEMVSYTMHIFNIIAIKLSIRCK